MCVMLRARERECVYYAVRERESVCVMLCVTECVMVMERENALGCRRENVCVQFYEVFVRHSVCSCRRE